MLSNVIFKFKGKHTRHSSFHLDLRVKCTQMRFGWLWSGLKSLYLCISWGKYKYIPIRMPICSSALNAFCGLWCFRSSYSLQLHLQWCWLWCCRICTLGCIHALPLRAPYFMASESVQQIIFAKPTCVHVLFCIIIVIIFIHKHTQVQYHLIVVLIL